MPGVNTTLIFKSNYHKKQAKYNTNSSFSLILVLLEFQNSSVPTNFESGIWNWPYI
jgi:hypothetical protein